MTSLILAAIAFVGTHFLLSHPLRAPVVEAITERGFLLVYSVVSMGTLVWLSLAYRAAPETPMLWPVGDAVWAMVSAVMLVASILLVGSLVGNPAMVDPNGTATAPAEACGVYAMTRHPMMWAFALWALCHIAVYPLISNVILASAIIILALVGARLQDAKKERLQPDVWPEWESKTSWWPFAAIAAIAAIAAGRARFGGFRPHDWAGGLIVWLVATWAHIPLVGWAAGIWRWL